MSLPISLPLTLGLFPHPPQGSCIGSDSSGGISGWISSVLLQPLLNLSIEVSFKIADYCAVMTVADIPDIDMATVQSYRYRYGYHPTQCAIPFQLLDCRCTASGLRLRLRLRLGLGLRLRLRLPPSLCRSSCCTWIAFSRSWP